MSWTTVCHLMFLNYQLWIGRLTCFCKQVPYGFKTMNEINSGETGHNIYFFSVGHNIYFAICLFVLNVGILG
jgi:hypothetical protein